jgi:hypothetical protein
MFMATGVRVLAGAVKGGLSDRPERPEAKGTVQNTLTPGNEAGEDGTLRD